MIYQTNKNIFAEHLINSFMKYLLTAFVLSLFLFGCQTEPEANQSVPEIKQASLNPNGDSELALLMRQMADELDALKVNIDTELDLSKISNYKTIHTAAPTKESMKEKGYQSYAQAFLLSIEALEQSTPANRIETYNQVIKACMNCHEVTCHGPMRRIEKMYVEMAEEE
jgi:hypothetical protein